MADCRDPKCKVYPMTATCEVAPLDCSEKFNLSQPDCEKLLMTGYADEQTQIAGTPVDYWGLAIKDSPKDPLYGEPTERVWNGPFRFYGIFQAPPTEPAVEESGIDNIYPTMVSIPRKAFEDVGMDIPREGDVVHVWDLPLYVRLSTLEPEALPGSGYYFDVLNADPDGYLVDSPIFATWSITLKRRAVFTPERRLQRP